MKKMMLSLAATFALAVAFAQPPATAGKQKPKMEHGTHHKGHHGHKMMAFSKLNLTEEQKAKMKTYNDDYRKQRKDLNAKEDITVKQQRDQRSAFTKAHKAKVQGLLTSEQKQQLVQIKAGAKKKRQEMVAKRLDKMKAELSLTDAQYASIKQNQEKTRAKFEAIKDNDKLERTAKKEQLMALKDEMKANMDNVLNDEQKAKMKEIRKQRQEKKGKFKEMRDNNAEVK